MSAPNTHYVIKFGAGGYATLPGGGKWEFDSRMEAMGVIVDRVRSREWFDDASVVKVTRKPRQVFAAVVNSVDRGSHPRTSFVRSEVTVFGNPDLGRPFTLKFNAVKSLP